MSATLQSLDLTWCTKITNAGMQHVAHLTSLLTLELWQREFIDAVYGNFPFVLLFVIVLTYVLLVRAFRSLLLPLKAVLLNCTLKKSPDRSHTQGLVDISSAIMRKHGVDVEVLRAVDHDIATGVYPDMTEHGWATDEEMLGHPLGGHGTETVLYGSADIPAAGFRLESRGFFRSRGAFFGVGGVCDKDVPASRQAAANIGRRIKKGL